jgi:radical SAM protein with 4Fe4S-binding SPASM domain
LQWLPVKKPGQKNGNSANFKYGLPVSYLCKGENIVEKEKLINIPDELSTLKHGGHTLRTGRKIVDRDQIGKINLITNNGEKQPNQYNGHTLKNKGEKYRLDGHKLIYHLDRVLAWQKGERIAPIHIDMGITKFCNVGCIYCIGVTQGMTRGVMIERGALLRMMDDCDRLGVRSIAFIGDAEPTLNPALYDAISRGKKAGIDMAMATNGVLINMDYADDILRDLTFIRFNLSSGDRDSFLKIHQSKPANFDLLVEKMKALVKLKKSKQYECTVGIQMVLIPENFDQIIKLARLGGEIGVDYLQIKQCSDSEYKEIGVQYEDYERATDDLKAAEKLSNSDYSVKVKWQKINIANETDVYKGGIRKYDICYGTPFLGQVSGNGKVYPCGPFFGKERFCMGDIHEQSYYDIVKGDRYWQVHKDIVNNVDVHYDCTTGCRQDYINKFLWDLKNPPAHVNFI